MPYTEEYIKQMEHYIRELRNWRLIFAVMNTLAAISIGALVFLWIGQRDAIQQQRYDSVLRNCEDQNSRRAHTISTLNNEILHLTPRRRMRAEKNEVYTIALINSLAPHQNCLILAHLATHTK